jgi:hypothetical protein
MPGARHNSSYESLSVVVVVVVVVVILLDVECLLLGVCSV